MSFIVLEGIDGCGKTTQARLLADSLAASGQRVCHTREPTDGPIGALIRRELQRERRKDEVIDQACLALLFAADRLEHVNTVIAPALAEGKVVVCDRYTLSNYAYQGILGGRVLPQVPALLAKARLAWVQALNQFAWVQALNQFAPDPDLTIIFDVSPEVAAERRAARAGTPDCFEVPELQSRLAEAYARAERWTPGRFVHVDGNLDPSAVHAAVLAQVRAL